MTAAHRIAASVLAVACTVTGCVGHARTTDAYRGKASHSAEEAASALQTALLSVQLSAKGNMLDAYLETVLSQAEDDFSSIEQQFDSIQPPNTDAADQLQSRLDDLLTKGSDTLSQLRILARRDDQAEMVKTAGDIPALVTKFTKFTKFQQATA
jgi:hypothetical protein